MPTPSRAAIGKAAAVVFCAAALLSFAGEAVAQGTAGQVSRLEEDVNLLRVSTNQLREQYLVPEQVIREYSFATAFVDARYLFNYGSWDAVVELLLPLVENDSNRSSGGYAEATFMLAESLFEQRNLLMARRYYEELANDRTFALDSARRRLEIALAMGRYDALEDLYRDLERRAGTAADDQVNYVRGKALYFQGRYADAVNALNAVQSGSLLYDMARYVVGVCHTRMGQLDRGHAEFAGILERLGEPTADEPVETTDLRDLSRLAQGRLFYEQSDWLGAIDAYILVPRNSNHYDAALYEIAWTQIRQGSDTDERGLRDDYFDAALNNLEVLQLVADRDSRFQAQAQLLRGDLLLRMERYEEAVVQFDSVNDHYLPVEQELREISAEHEDPDLFFDAIVNPEEGSLRLPIAARPWFESDPQLDRALLAIQDVEVLRTEVQESQQLIDQLDAVLNSGGRVNAFPRLREGWARAASIQVEAIDLMVALVETEAAAITPSMNPTDSAEYEALRRRRSGLQSQLASQPRTFAEIGEREQTVVDELNQMVLEVHRTELQIAAAREDLDALREIYIERAGQNPSVDLRSIRRDLDAEDRRLADFEEAAAAMRRELYVRQVAVGVSDDVGASERDQRARFLAALAEEERFLAARRSVAPNSAAAFTSIDRLIRELVAIDQDCETFYVDVDRMVAEQTADMRDLLEAERANVESYEARLVNAEAEARSTAGQVAFGAFEEVYFRFSELTLRANLGIIDVAWRQKEVLTQTIEELFEERNQSLRELDADFAELLEDE